MNEGRSHTLKRKENKRENITAEEKKTPISQSEELKLRHVLPWIFSLSVLIKIDVRS